ncbi:uncharacterized protein [Littorina saxatilis]|uniref:Uncharacterized protein n=1 Tax=Littorina saxatilis TaxID=31220 RepID=A0AAN9BFT1_9CAEN
MKLKKTSDNADALHCDVLWQFRASETFNVFCVDRVLSPPTLGLILGGEDGIIRVYEMEGQPSAEPKAMVETKGGPIQCLATHNVTRLGQVDILAADAQGTLTVVCGQQILCRQSLASHAITCLQVQEDGRGYLEIVSSTETGLITACQSSSQLWTINLNDHIKVSRRCFVAVKCLLSVELPDCHGHNVQYLLAADDTCQLHLILQGQIVASFKTPAQVTAMAQGVFVPSSQLSMPASPGAGGGHYKQVALGTDTGAIYIFYNMAISAEEIVRSESPITHLAALQMPDSPLDLLLCAGHVKALNVYRHDKLIHRYATKDWINCMVTADLDKDGTREVIIGCMDRTIAALKFSPF